MKLYYRRLIVIFCTIGVLVVGLFLAWHDSPTTDEDIHIASAYLGLTRHEFRFDPEHPYLFKVLTALPLLTIHLNPPPDDAAYWEEGRITVYDSWKAARGWADEWFYTSGNNPELMIFLARIPAVICLTLLCLLVYFLASRWFSPTIGLWALIFTAFNPNLLAHGHLANNDVPTALLFLLTIWAMWEYFLHPNLRQAVILGVAFAAAELTKFSM